MRQTEESKQPGGNGDTRISSAPAKPDLEDIAAGGGAENTALDFLLDIPLELRVEVGRATITMGELSRAREGTVIELNRPSGESLDILANGKVVARGEAVLIGDRYGIRILEIMGSGKDFAARSKKGTA